MLLSANDQASGAPIIPAEYRLAEILKPLYQNDFCDLGCGAFDALE
jgi:hypothetical protein